MIDLHMHTEASDGHHAPGELLRRVRAAGITTFSVTDHDTVAALPEARDLAGVLDLSFVAGIEITTVHSGRDVHLLGYFFDFERPALLAFLRAQREARLRRVETIVARLADLGVPIDSSRLFERAGTDRALARPHVARALIEAGHVTDVAEAFDRFLSPGRPAYVDRVGPSPAEGIRIIREAGGLASMAHPGVTSRDELIAGLAAAGLDALEVYHSDHDPASTARYLAQARSLGLLVTGGSDYHGEQAHRGAVLGTVGLPPDAFAALAGRARRDGA